ncbi:FUSC family protein [Streptomyces sp. NPDC014791]|uniref:FUSC family protein n=1 Tax=Streptomyces sp. NPDC014791 TaxID=3364912 RepID=UPI0036F64F5F
MDERGGMADTSGRQPPPAQGGKAATWLSRVFEVSPAGLNWPRGVMFLDVALVPLIVFWAIGYEQYLLSAVFGLLFAALEDPGGSYRSRAWHIALFGLIGAGVTALGFGIGGQDWGWMALTAFVVTLAAGLMVAFGTRRFVNALLLNIWFIIALALGFGLHDSAHITSYAWAQAVSWAGGSLLWIVITFLWWLSHGRRDRPQPVAELPGDTARRKLTRPMIMFAVIRALVMFATVALAFGLNLDHGLWMPIAAMVAMKPSLEQSTLVAAQRLAGALIGAVAAALLLLIPTSEHGLKLFAVTRGLEMVALILFMHGAAIRFWNYAYYCAAIAAAVLILLDLQQPSDYAAEGYRVLWTLCGAGLGVLVMLLAGLLGKRAAKRTTKAPPHPA